MKRISLTGWIFIGMAAGVALGMLAPDFAKQLGPASNVFLRLIRSIIAPLLFGTLVYGIAGGGDIETDGPHRRSRRSSTSKSSPRSRCSSGWAW